MSVQSIPASQLALTQSTALQARQAPAQEDPKAQQAERRSTVAEADRARQSPEVAKGDEAKSGSPVDRQQLERALENIRRVVEPVAHNLQFTVDDDTGRTVVKVMDGATDQVIRQIPSEEILSIAKALDKLSGLLLEQKA
ncbi:MAG: flagellar protein FlaG [Rhodocyclaceae bacterium]|nr:flagellar protein FlaG [Rhodocyclaceae bacterium]